MREIKSVSLEFPMSADGTVIYYTVGENGITSIKKALKNGKQASISYFEIFKDHLIVAELHHFSHVVYFQEVKP